MGILLIVFPFSISSTYFRKSRSRWKPYGVSTEYGGFPLTPFSFVFGGKLLPGGVKTRHQCLFRGNILRIFFFTFLFFHHVPVFSLTNRFFSLISEKRKNQITSQTAIKHKNSRREYPEISRGKITFYLRFHSEIWVTTQFCFCSSTCLLQLCFSHTLAASFLPGCYYSTATGLIFTWLQPCHERELEIAWKFSGRQERSTPTDRSTDGHCCDSLFSSLRRSCHCYMWSLRPKSSFTWLRCLFPFSGVWSRIFPAPLVAVRDRCTPELFSWPPASAAAPNNLNYAVNRQTPQSFRAEHFALHH